MSNESTRGSNATGCVFVMKGLKSALDEVKHGRTPFGVRAGEKGLTRRSGMESLESRLLMANTFYVSTLGSDAAVGSLASPFKTISKAANVAQPGDVVNIRGGIYRETITPARSGSASSPITYQSYNNEPVTVSGADRLSGFTSVGGGIYKASMPWTLGAGNNQVFVNGGMINEARWPNQSLDSISRPITATFDSATYTTNTTTGLTNATITDAGLTQPAGFWVGSTLHAAMGNSTVVVSGTVTSSQPGKLVISYYANSSTGYPEAGDQFHLTGGKLVTLDSTNEWFRDTTGNLYARVTGDVDPDSTTVEVKRRQNTFDLSGKSYITVRNLRTFAGTIVTSDSSSHIVLNQITAMYVSHFSLTDPKKYGGNTTGASTSGIYLRGAYNTLSNSDIQYSAGNGVYLNGSNHTVTNNVFHDIAYSGTDCAAINTLYPTTPNVGHNISYNTVFNAGRHGIRITGLKAGQVTHNEIYNFGLQTADGGGIYAYDSDGAGTVVAYNSVHDGFNTLNDYWPAGLYLDERSSNYVVHHNLTYNVGDGMIVNGSSSNNQIYNNTIVGARRGLATLSNKTFTSVNFTNNIIVGSVSTFPGAGFSSNLINATGVNFQSVGSNNYQLAGGSVGINTGKSLGGSASLVGSPDIGAYEYGTAPWSAGASWSVTPGEPTNLVATAGGSSIVRLAWSAASGTTRAYYVDRSSDGIVFTQVARVTGTSWSNTALTASTKYFYRVRADDSPYSAVVSAKTNYGTRSVIQAEDYSAMSGVQNYGTGLGSLDAGDFIRLDNFDFQGGARTFTARIGLPSGVTGRKIEIRTGSPTGTLLGTLNIAATGGYQKFTNQSTTLTNAPTGVTTLYIVFKGGSGCGNVDNWSLT